MKKKLCNSNEEYIPDYINIWNNDKVEKNKEMSLLNTFRREVNLSKDGIFKEDGIYKIRLFILYLNKKLDRLMKNQICSNAKIYGEYHRLTGTTFNSDDYSYLHLKKIPISEFRDEKDYYRSVTKEAAYYNKLLSFNIDFVDVLNNQPQDTLGELMYDINQGAGAYNINVKSAFKYLESVNKELDKFKKIAGYLKSRAVKPSGDSFE